MTTVVGIDPSLTNTGLARITWGTDGWLPETWHRPSVGKTKDSLADRQRRIVGITADALSFCEPCDLAVVEAPSFGSRGGSAWDRAYLWWQIVGRLINHATPVVTIAPTSRALWATGSGRADKAAVSASIARMWPTAELRSSDEADALALASIGLQLLGDDVPFDITAYRTRALAKVEVPEGLDLAE